MTNTAGYAWLSFSFLRAVRANLAFERLEGTAHLVAFACGLINNVWQALVPSRM